MKKILGKILLFVVCLFGSIAIFSKILNLGSTDMTREMSKASLPVVYMKVNNHNINKSYGYVSDILANYIRRPVTPINANRTLDIHVNTYGTAVASVGYEIRSIDTKRLIEDTMLESFEYQKEVISATFAFKDLMEEDTEYLLVTKLITGDGKEIKYYSRIINTSEIALSDKMEFVYDFSDKTFDEVKAPELKKYMESNSEGDNSSFAYVNIHSSFKQLTWGTLKPEVIGDKNLDIISIDKQSATMKLSYRVFIKNKVHNVEEYFRITLGKKRMHLMDYERIMNRCIGSELENDLVVNGKIVNGIVNEKITFTESPNASIVVFTQQNGLFSFNQSTGQLARIFSFWNSDNSDERTFHNEHGIKALSIDEAGNINFIVYGYMNRGDHEGSVGVTLYYYDAVVNTVEEQLFIPYNKSFDILKADIEQLSYINIRNQLFILLDGNIYGINLEALSVEIIAKDLDENKFVSTTDNSVIAWQTGDSVSDFTSIQFYPLDAMNPETIDAKSGTVIKPLGFIGEDLVCGTARKDDISKDYTGRTIVPMYKIEIKDNTGNILMKYEKDGVYVTDIEITDEMLELSRVVKEEAGYYRPTDNDQILNNGAEIVTKNVYDYVITEEMETTYQIVLAKEKTYDSVKVITPKEVVFEGNRSILLQNLEKLNKYFFYENGHLNGIYLMASDAVIAAEDSYGNVVNDGMHYIWQSENRKASAKLDEISTVKITDEQALEGLDSISVCLEQMLEYNGIFKDADSILSGSKTVFSVLSDNLPEKQIFDLTGCSLDSILYYVSCGSPVIAFTENNMAVLIVGYDSNNVLIYDPIVGEIIKRGRYDAKAYFDFYGNRYVSYLE